MIPMLQKLDALTNAAITLGIDEHLACDMSKAERYLSTRL